MCAAYCRDAEDNFYDRTEAVQRQKRNVVPESLDAATLLGQKASTSLHMFDLRRRVSNVSWSNFCLNNCDTCFCLITNFAVTDCFVRHSGVVIAELSSMLLRVRETC